MSSWPECATFSLHVYCDQDQPPLPDGWDILLECPDDLRYEGYFAIAYINTTSNIRQNVAFYDVVIAHRGTVDAWGAWNDFWLALEDVPGQFEKGAYLFDEYVRQFLAEKYPDTNYFLTHTGHSLGAVLAELCVAASVKYESSGTSSLGMSFESPGSRSIIEDLEAEGKLPTGAFDYAQNYMCICQADVDAINTCNVQIVKQYYPTDVSNVGFDYEKDSEGIDINVPNTLAYFLNYTVRDQHHMLKMYRYWTSQSDRALTQPKISEIPWPVGLENGYSCYVNYDLRKDYWDAYIDYIWRQYPNMHVKFNNDFSSWHVFFVSALKETQSRLRISVNQHAIFNAATVAAQADESSRFCVIV